jgi:nitroreductase
MDFMDISRMRVTVRQFSNQKVEQEKVDKIIEAGRWSPTAVNYQPQRILVLDTPDTLSRVKEFCTFGFDKKYAELTKECADETHGKNVYYYGAPLVLFVCYDKTACWKHPQNGKISGETDATIVATHMMLEAASIGLGSVWISYFDEEKARQLLQIPNDYVPVCMLYIGYKADDFVPNPIMSGKRYPIEHTVFYNKFKA